jgi:acetolactate synthase regulatory subunit
MNKSEEDLVMMLMTVEVIVEDDPDVLGRIVRVVSTRPFALAMLHYWPAAGTATRRVLMDVAVSGSAELLTKRLNRLVAVQRVRLLDHHDAAVPRAGVHRVAVTAVSTGNDPHIVRGAD